MQAKTISKINYLLEFLNDKNYSQSTIKTYCNFARRILTNKINLKIKKSTLNIYLAVQKLMLEAKIIRKKRIKEQNNNPRNNHNRELYIHSKIPSENELKRIFENSNDDYKFIFELAMKTGLRISEIVNLEREDIKNRTGNIFEITVKNGKGNKFRITYLVNPSPFLIEKLKTFKKLKKGLKAIESYCYNRKKRLNINFSFHSFRHLFAVNLLKQNFNIMEIAKLLGHSSIKTTQIYLNITSNDIFNKFLINNNMGVSYA